ncbi:hypothetical protein ACFL5E_02220 [Candidatus Omnitrophota bacterium]
MSGKIKVIIVGCILAVHVLSSAGCAAAWFLVGAGTAATVGAVAAEQKKDK